MVAPRQRLGAELWVSGTSVLSPPHPGRAQTSQGHLWCDGSEIQGEDAAQGGEDGWQRCRPPPCCAVGPARAASCWGGGGGHRGEPLISTAELIEVEQRRARGQHGAGWRCWCRGNQLPRRLVHGTGAAPAAQHGGSCRLPALGARCLRAGSLARPCHIPGTQRCRVGNASIRLLVVPTPPRPMAVPQAGNPQAPAAPRCAHLPPAHGTVGAPLGARVPVAPFAASRAGGGAYLAGSA